ncbi:N-acetylglucosamine kinase [Pseudoalteromonas sp. SG41-1]|uniref:BadF/BadG/BcrA/BcrD ATPase family protein n=1 Tax=Pseudoalteromonas sp. SG41-1 TaxID=2760979 RepID=UPI0016015BC5|nr:BadF/BadG/BcrA/BcrD ATPase family protein [Pseudoalteromonas sp. SG41-1]MBB1505139.1 N-acetylglucosamine kinase [Pseudoalteromonas sp. SG41-1]
MTNHFQPPLYLGIDGGGTKCRVRLENAQGTLLAEAVSGAANIATSVEVAQQSIIDATTHALQQAGLGLSTLGAIYAYAGLAGAGIAGANKKMAQWQHPFAQFNFSTDLHIACQGAHGDNSGAIIILGTGFCAGAIKNGNVIELGGHGLLLSDGASGGWIGLTLFRYALEVLDGLSPSSPLINTLLAQLNCDTSNQLTELALNARPAYFAGFAPLVFAMQDDPWAIIILEQAARYITRYIDHLVSLGYHNITLMGGTAEKITPWLSTKAQGYLCDAHYLPEQGAIQLAKRLA